jgi:hypothetical protein
MKNKVWNAPDVKSGIVVIGLVVIRRPTISKTVSFVPENFSKLKSIETFWFGMKCFEF